MGSKLEKRSMGIDSLDIYPNPPRLEPFRNPKREGVWKYRAYILKEKSGNSVTGIFNNLRPSCREAKNDVWKYPQIIITAFVHAPHRPHHVANHLQGVCH